MAEKSQLADFLSINNKYHYSGMEFIMTEKQKYSFLTGLGKTIKNSTVLLVPFFLAILAGMDIRYAWVTGPLAYFLKNWYDNRTK